MPPHMLCSRKVAQHGVGPVDAASARTLRPARHTNSPSRYQPIQPHILEIHMTIPAPSPPRPEQLPPDVTPKLPLPPDISPDMPLTPLNDPLPPLAPPSIIA